MRILFIAHYFEPDSGAAPNRLTRLAKQLEKRGHDITVLTTMPHYPVGVVHPDYRGRFTISEQRGHIRVIRVWLYAATSQRIVFRLMNQISFMLSCSIRGLFVKRPDVIYVENWPVFTALAGWFISRVKRAPYLANVSDFWPDNLLAAGVTTKTRLDYRLFTAFVNHTQRRAAGIVALYPPLLSHIEKRIGRRDIAKVIYNAVDTERFNGQADEAEFRKKHRLGKARLITFLGILGYHIDLDTMLEVARRFKDVPDVKFVFTGAGKQKCRLQKVLAAAEYAHCRWIDWIDYDEVPAFWAASYLSYWALADNPLDQMRFQAKLYEAMGSGTPTVIAVRGLMQEVIAEAGSGIAAAPGDVKAMTAAIAKLLEDEDVYRQMSENGRRYAQRHFCVKRNVDEYEAILRQAAESP